MAQKAEQPKHMLLEPRELGSPSDGVATMSETAKSTLHLSDLAIDELFFENFSHKEKVSVRVRANLDDHLSKVCERDL